MSGYRVGNAYVLGEVEVAMDGRYMDLDLIQRAVKMVVKCCVQGGKR